MRRKPNAFNLVWQMRLLDKAKTLEKAEVGFRARHMMGLQSGRAGVVEPSIVVGGSIQDWPPGKPGGHELAPVYR